MNIKPAEFCPFSGVRNPCVSSGAEIFGCLKVLAVVGKIGSRLQFVYILEHGLKKWVVLEGQVHFQCFFIDFFMKMRVGKERFDLRTKKQTSVHFCIIERFDSEIISCAVHGVIFLVINYEGEHAAEHGSGLLAVGLVSLENDFGVGIGWRIKV